VHGPADLGRFGGALTEISRKAAVQSAQPALEPDEQIQQVFLGQTATDRDDMRQLIELKRSGQELPPRDRFSRFAVMASERNLYVFPQGNPGSAIKILATRNLVPLITDAVEKHPIGSIPVTQEGKRLVVGDLRLKIVRINRKDAEALVSFVQERGSHS
jgi:hypothetical protein